MVKLVLVFSKWGKIQLQYFQSLVQPIKAQRRGLVASDQTQFDLLLNTDSAILYWDGFGQVS